MVPDKSYSSDQRARIEGFLKKWRKTSVLCFYFEVLLPVSKLSLALQQEDIDPVKAIDALLTIKDKLTKLKEIPVDQFSPISTIKRKSSINEDNDLVCEDVVLKEMEEELVKLTLSCPTYFEHRTPEGGGGGGGGIHHKNKFSVFVRVFLARGIRI